MEQLDPHERPPEAIRAVYKKYQKMKLKELEQDEDIIDLSNDDSSAANGKTRVVKELAREDIVAAFRAFAGNDLEFSTDEVPSRILVYEHEDMPGLHLIPALLSPSLQPLLLSRLLHRDLSNSAHLTNIHTHYALTYPSSTSSTSSSYPPSFFSSPPTLPTPIATPLDPTIHTPLPIASLLTKKLRWTTLGGQYNWTAKRYPTTLPPPFPSDIKNLLESVFTDTKAEAAIVNLYSPGDTLSPHRDVAETSGRGLVSVSLGCDGVFVIGITSTEERRDKILTLRLRSGSAVYMSGASRFAWHGVPQIVAGTCPEYLKDWPGTREGGGEYEAWRGWMEKKRVNLNVRQMWD